MSFVGVVIALVVGSSGCGGDDVGADAGAGDAAAADAGFLIAMPPAPPTDPAPPALGPCPKGWSERVDGALTLCEPWPLPPPAPCEGIDARWPGRPSCSPLGTTCAADGFPSDLPAGATVRYVLAGASGAADGTRAAPFPRISDATTGAAPGTVIAIGRGSYDEAIAVPAEVTLVGACPAETELRSSLGGTPGVVDARGAGVVVRNLRIGPSARPGATALGFGRELTLEDVVIDGAAEAGVVVTPGGMLTLRRVAIRWPDAGARGFGARVEGGLVAAGLDVDRAERAAVAVLLGGNALIEDAWLHGSRAMGDAAGVGIATGPPSTVEASRVAIEANQGAAMLIAGAGSSAVVADGVLRANLPDGYGRFGRGLSCQLGASVDLRRTLVADNRDVGIFAEDDPVLTLTDVVVLDTRVEELDGRGGRGMELQRGSSLVATRLWLDRNREVGLLLSASTAEIDDFVSRSTASRDDGTFGYGAQLQTDSTLTLRRGRIEENLGVGLTLFQATADVEDLVVQSTRSRQPSRTLGRGVDLEGGAMATMRRVLVADNRDIGVFVSMGSSLTIEDVAIVRTESEEATGDSGRGLNVQQSATVRVTRGLIEDSREIALYATLGADVGLVDVRVSRTRARACAATTCPDEPGGSGILAIMGRIEATRFEVDESLLCGVHVLPGAEIDLSMGVVRRASIGACLQSEGYDVDRLSNDVRYEENGTNLDSTMLPVPELRPDL